jgi:apolipoprotein N-acyltransferase
MRKKKAGRANQDTTRKKRKLRPFAGLCGGPRQGQEYGWALGFITVVLLILSFPATNLDILIWVALVPWLLALGKVKIKGALGLSYAVGFLFFVIVCAWLRYITVLGWFLLSFYLGVFFAAAGVGVWLLRRYSHRGWIFVFPLLWVALEYLRARIILLGFPWYFLGHTQYQRIALIQIADVSGVYGISFLVALANSSITAILGRYFKGSEITAREKQRSPLIAVGLTLILIALSLIYGKWRLGQMRLEPGPRIGIVQGNIPQRLKEEAIAGDELTARDIFLRHLQLTFNLQDETLDLILWPETMVPGRLNKDVQTQKIIGEVAQTLDVPLLVGAVTREANENEIFDHNSAYHFSKEGTIIKRYDKFHLVPFGEFVPLRRYFPWLGRLVPYPTNFRPGSEFTIFEVGESRFSVAICFEDTFPYLVRKFRRAGADFLVNLTNDGWFRDSAELDQHMAFAVFRTVENRLGLVRAANTGISCFVLPSGEISKVLQNAQGKRRELQGTLAGQIFIDSRKTFYSTYGDVFVISSLVILAFFGVGLFWHHLRKEKRQRQKSP